MPERIVMARLISFFAVVVSLAICSALHAEPPRIQFDSPSPATCLAWEPWGKQFVIGTSVGSVHFVDAATGKEQRRVATGAPLLAIACSPWGKQIAISQKGKGVSVCALANGTRLKTGAARGHVSDELAFSLDGETVVGVAIGGILQLKVNGNGVRIFKSGTGSGRGAGVAADGSIAGWVDIINGKSAIRWANLEGGGSSMILNKVTVTSVAFGPQFRLAVGQNDIKVHIQDHNPDPRAPRPVLKTNYLLGLPSAPK